MFCEEKFAEMLERYPYLYDKQHEAHSNRIMLEDAYQVIAIASGLENAAAAKRKLAYVKNEYSKKKRWAENRPSGSGSQQTHPILRRFSFLAPYLRQNTTKGNWNSTPKLDHFSMESSQDLTFSGETGVDSMMTDIIASQADVENDINAPNLCTPTLQEKAPIAPGTKRKHNNSSSALEESLNDLTKAVCGAWASTSTPATSPTPEIEATSAQISDKTFANFLAAEYLDAIQGMTPTAKRRFRLQLLNLLTTRGD